MKKALLTLAIIILAIFSSCDLGLEIVRPEEGSVNAYIYPYFKFELSNDLTHYVVTVVEGANFEKLYIPGEYQTEFGVMPVKMFGGFENPKDASSLKELHLGANIEFIADDALIYAYNLQLVEHDSNGESRWTYLPKLKKSGCHFIGWQAGDEMIWEMIDDQYVQNVYKVNSEHTIATPVFVELVWKDSTLPTCTESGFVSHYYCEHCGKAYSDANGENSLASTTIAALGHHLVYKPGKEATCQTEGLVGHYYCQRCEGKFLDVECTEPIGNVVLSKVNHQADGIWHSDHADFHYHECVWCREVMNREEHDFDEGVITREETKENDAIKTYTCLTCGYQKDVEVSGHEHVLGEDKTFFEATCTEGAYYTGRCIACGRICQIYESNALGHDFTLVEYVASTCQIEGVEKHHHCERCNLNFANEAALDVVENTVIAKIDHEFETLLSHNETHHWYKCSTCNPELGIEVKDYSEHIFEENIEGLSPSIDATCTSPAVYFKNCVCGEHSNETFEHGSPLGHEYKKDGKVNYVYETINDNEEHWIECLRCHEEKEGTREKHDYSDRSQDGLYRICTDCGSKMRDRYQSGFTPTFEDVNPKGCLEFSKDGDVYTFKIVNTNIEFPITSCKWEISRGEALSVDNEFTFKFRAPIAQSYTVRCVFTNGYGTASLSETVRGGVQQEI